MDVNDPHDDDKVLDFLMEADLVDFHNDYFVNRPPTYKRGSSQIDMIVGSYDLQPYITNAYIGHPDVGPGDHSVIGCDLNFGALINRDDLSKLDPTTYRAET